MGITRILGSGAEGDAGSSLMVMDGRVNPEASLRRDDLELAVSFSPSLSLSPSVSLSFFVSWFELSRGCAAASDNRGTAGGGVVGSSTACAVLVGEGALVPCVVGSTGCAVSASSSSRCVLLSTGSCPPNMILPRLEKDRLPKSTARQSWEMSALIGLKGPLMTLSAPRQVWAGELEESVEAMRAWEGWLSGPRSPRGPSSPLPGLLAPTVTAKELPVDEPTLPRCRRGGVRCPLGDLDEPSEPRMAALSAVDALADALA